MPNVNIGGSVSLSAVSVSRRPRWIAPTSPTVVGGTVQGPTGVRQIVYGTADVERLTAWYNIYLPSGASEPTTSGDWLAVIWDFGGHYLKADGLDGIDTIGTPVVRLTDNGPAKAVLTLPPIGTYTWSDGSTAAIERGMGLSVAFRDADTQTLTTVFRGIIRQIDRGETVAVTAYDRVMDLAEFSDQYQPPNNHGEETAWNPTSDGTNYTYTFSDTIGTMVSAYTYNRLTTNPLPALGTAYGDQSGEVYFMPVPDYTQDGNSNDIAPTGGTTISEVKVKFAYDHNGSSDRDITITAMLCRANSARTYVTRLYKTSATVTTSADSGDYTATFSVSWTMPTTVGGGIYLGFCVDPDKGDIDLYRSSSRYFTSNDRPWLKRGSLSSSSYFTVSENTASLVPQFGMTYIKAGASVSTSSITASGATATVAISTITDGPSATIGSATLTSAKGVGMTLDYYTSTGLSVSTLVTDLINAAGLAASIPDDTDLGTLSYYTTTTYDYLTCIHELIRAGNYGVKDTYDIGSEGTIRVLPRHTIDETPAATYSTDPSSAGTRAIVSHSLTAHWMAERATQAIIAEDATNSGLPIALETDDERMDNSLALALGSPLRGVSTDSSAGTHAMLASAAGGKIVQLHTNVYEGSVVLAGYRTSVWDLSSDGEGGLPIGLDVPEASASGTAIPTEVILHDGITEVSLDNIRTADRSEVARSMGLTADSVSNSSQQIADTVYIFGKLLTYYTDQSGSQPASYGTIYLMDKDGSVLTSQSTSAYIKKVADAAGYTHYCAYIAPDSDGYADSTPVAMVGIGTSSNEYRVAPLDNPKYVLTTQACHVDIRVPNGSL